MELAKELRDEGVSCGGALINCVRSYKAIRMCRGVCRLGSEKGQAHGRAGTNFLLYQFNAYLKCGQRTKPAVVGADTTATRQRNRWGQCR